MRLPEVKTTTGLSRSTIYELMKAHAFPKSISLSGRSVGWIESEVRKWVEERIATGRSN